jgi:hypothetical protein
MTTRAVQVLLVLSMLVGFTIAQTSIPYIEMTPDTARVGDPVTLRIVIPEQEDDGDIEWPSVGEQLGDFTVLNVDTLIGKSAEDLDGVALELTIAAYDTGSFSTGPIDFSVGGDPWTLPGDSVRIASVLADTTVNLRPLKSQAELKLTFADWLKYYGPWVGGGLLLALLGWLFWRWWTHRRNRGEATDDSIPVPDPYEQAISAMAELKQNNPLERGDVKTYVSTLVFITKRLFEREFEEPILEMTSYEVRRWMKRATISFDSKMLMRLLSASDTVKFARGTLEKEAAQNLYLNVESIIEEFRPRPELVENYGVRESINAETDEILTTATAKNPRGGSVGKEFELSAEPSEPASWSSTSTEHSSQTSSDTYTASESEQDSDVEPREDRS